MHKKLNDEVIDMDAILGESLSPDMEPITMRNFIKSLEDMKNGKGKRYTSNEEYKAAMAKLIEEAGNIEEGNEGIRIKADEQNKCNEEPSIEISTQEQIDKFLQECEEDEMLEKTYTSMKEILDEIDAEERGNIKKNVNKSEEIDLNAIICNTIEPDMEPITLRNLIKMSEDMEKGIDVEGSCS